ncbi:MAG: hypothetical protein RL385_327 [Pseudomonadota bacterium]|jgi:hypothetical protein
MRLGVVAVLGLAGACSAGTHVREVELAFAERTNTSAPDAGSLAGFTCLQTEVTDAGATETLVHRALTPFRGGMRSLALSMVVQAFALDDNPGCRDTALANYCGPGDTRCRLLPDSTFCVALESEPLPLTTTGRTARLHAALSALATAPDAGLSGALFTDEPPAGWVLLRAVGTTETCERVADERHAFDRAQLVGCAFTCPVVLSSWSGKLWFDSAAAGRCEAQVQACAGTGFSPVPYEPDGT